ncbi:kinase-like domain-containing protein [Hyaloraphidium curvatum]|nr:kinase-like domain-containing protein [Hyaloraphidium curvatum]
METNGGGGSAGGAEPPGPRKSRWDELEDDEDRDSDTRPRKRKRGKEKTSKLAAADAVDSPASGRWTIPAEDRARRSGTPDSSSFAPPRGVVASPSRSPYYPDSPRPRPREVPAPWTFQGPPLTSCRSVDNFEKLNRIEEGAYGIVYRARDRRTGEIVALKKLKLDKEKNGFPVTSLREIQTLLLSKHPNIVNVKEIAVGESLTSVFIVMEFIEHDLKSLMEVMRSRSTTFLQSEVKTVMLQLLSAVRHLHDNWIIHRDLKTSNLLMNNRGMIKVADFGLARRFGSPLGPMTQLVVTLWYRAPELLLGAKEYTTAIDMWSIGCIFAEVVNNEPLMQGRNEIDQLTKMFQLLGTPTEAVWPGYQNLPNAQTISFAHQPHNKLRTTLPFMTQAGLDLLQQLLTYDPEQRITADGALKHAYFREAPAPKDPSMFPTFPSKASGEKQKAFVSPSAPHAHDAAEEEEDVVAEGSLFELQSRTGAGSFNLSFNRR